MKKIYLLLVEATMVLSCSNTMVFPSFELACDGEIAVITDYVPNNDHNSVIEFKMKIDNATDEVGCGNEGAWAGGLSSYYNSSRKTFNILCDDYVNDYAYSYSLGSDIIIRMSKTQYVFNGVLKNIEDNALTSKKPIYIGSQWWSWQGTIYFIKIFENDKLIRNFIPKEVNGVATLVDSITGYVCEVSGSGTTELR